jgi:hypothetical protein
MCIRNVSCRAAFARHVRLHAAPTWAQADPAATSPPNVGTIRSEQPRSCPAPARRPHGRGGAAKPPDRSRQPVLLHRPDISLQEHSRTPERCLGSRVGTVSGGTRAVSCARNPTGDPPRAGHGPSAGHRPAQRSHETSFERACHWRARAAGEYESKRLPSADGHAGRVSTAAC